MGKLKSAKRTPQSNGKAKRFVKAKTDIGGMYVPFTMLPLSVWGAWRSGNWTEMHEKDVEFSYIKGRVIRAYRDPRYKNATADLGPLPSGWNCVYVSNDYSGVHEYFVAPDEVCRRCDAFSKRELEHQQQIDFLLHAGNYPAEGKR